MTHRTIDELDAGLAHIAAAPQESGTVALIVTRPSQGQRCLPECGRFEQHGGLDGDNWSTRGARDTPDGAAHPGREITLMNVRVAALVAGSDDPAVWALAGDQLYVDFDISEDNLPPGTSVRIGTAVIEITPEPHTGCKKFVERFGPAAGRWVNLPPGRRLRLRGANARVIEGGDVRLGDAVAKLSS